MAKQGLSLLQQEKPHTAVSAWIDTLCTRRYEEDDYEGIPELVESINLQTTGYAVLPCRPESCHATHVP